MSRYPNDLVLTTDRYPYSSPVSVKVPTLTCDQRAFQRHGIKLTVTGRIVANLIAHLAANHYRVIGVNDGDEEVATPAGDIKAVMEAAFTGDDAKLYVRHADALTDLDLPGAVTHEITLVFGRDLDVIGDRWIHPGDGARFKPVYDAFDTMVFA